MRKSEGKLIAFVKLEREGRNGIWVIALSCERSYVDNVHPYGLSEPHDSPWEGFQWRTLKGSKKEKFRFYWYAHASWLLIMFCKSYVWIFILFYLTRMSTCCSDYFRYMEIYANYGKISKACYYLFIFIFLVKSMLNLGVHVMQLIFVWPLLL